MRAYVNGHPVDVMPRFRTEGKGRAVFTVSLSVPLRAADAVAVLYWSRLSLDELADADAVRDTLATELLDHGADRLARRKAALQVAVDAGQHDQVRWQACQRRVRTLAGPTRRGRGSGEVVA